MLSYFGVFLIHRTLSMDLKIFKRLGVCDLLACMQTQGTCIFQPPPQDCVAFAHNLTPEKSRGGRKISAQAISLTALSPAPSLVNHLVSVDVKTNAPLPPTPEPPALLKKHGAGQKRFLLLHAWHTARNLALGSSCLPSAFSFFLCFCCCSDHLPKCLYVC